MNNEEYEVSFEEWWESLDDIERENYNMAIFTKARINK